ATREVRVAARCVNMAEAERLMQERKVNGIILFPSDFGDRLAGGRTAYETTMMTSGGYHGVDFDDSYSVSLEDEAFGEVEIVYLDGVECYAVSARFTKTGDTKLILEAPDGSRRYFALTVGRDTYRIEEITDAGG
ncbi:MAG: hypothetical protein J5592_06295, partial [Clostridia bacterium]|nr:hypothetical protein [Clostridia bacterium]